MENLTRFKDLEQKRRLQVLMGYIRKSIWSMLIRQYIVLRTLLSTIQTKETSNRDFLYFL